jgi:hypothetical protein
MKKLLIAAVAAVALAGPAHANIVDDYDHAWVLVGLGFANSVGLYGLPNVASDVGMLTEPQGSMPMYQTRGECLAAERRILAKYKGASHAAGGDGHYLCTPLSAFATPSF